MTVSRRALCVFYAILAITALPRNGVSVSPVRHMASDDFLIGPGDTAPSPRERVSGFVDATVRALPSGRPGCAWNFMASSAPVCSPNFPPSAPAP